MSLCDQCGKAELERRKGNERRLKRKKDHIAWSSVKVGLFWKVSARPHSCGALRETKKKEKQRLAAGRNNVNRRTRRRRRKKGCTRGLVYEICCSVRRQPKS